MATVSAPPKWWIRYRRNADFPTAEKSVEYFAPLVFMANRIGQWRKVYEEWKYWNPTMPLEEKRGYVRGCIGKFSYQNFLQAMLACQALQRDKGGNNNIYWCYICKGNHIGRHEGKNYFPEDL